MNDPTTPQAWPEAHGWGMLLLLLLLLRPLSILLPGLHGQSLLLLLCHVWQGRA